MKSGSRVSGVRIFREPELFEAVVCVRCYKLGFGSGVVVGAVRDECGEIRSCSIARPGHGASKRRKASCWCPFSSLRFQERIASMEFSCIATACTRPSRRQLAAFGKSWTTRGRRWICSNVPAQACGWTSCAGGAPPATGSSSRSPRCWSRLHRTASGTCLATFPPMQPGPDPLPKPILPQPRRFPALPRTCTLPPRHRLLLVGLLLVDPRSLWCPWSSFFETLLHTLETVAEEVTGGRGGSILAP